MVQRFFSKLNTFVALVTVMCVIGGTACVSADTIKGETSLGGASFYMSRFYDKTSEDDSIASLLADAVKIPENVAIANVNDYVNIRSKANTSSGVVGYLPKNGMCTVVSVSDGWAEIESGSVKGFVSTDYLYMGEEGRAKAEELASLMATVNANSVNFRSEPSTADDSNVLITLTKGEALQVIEETVINKDDSTTLWVKAYYDEMEGYIAKHLVNVAYDWIRAVSITSIVGSDYSESGLSSLRAKIVIEARKHLGLKYVWGGESLRTGADCSGFVRSVYKACGISITNLPRTSYDMASSSRGKKVSLANAKPGDLVFYGTSSGHVNHVAIYIGNGQIIHESGYQYGCRISNVGYRTIIKIKNFLD